LCSGVNLGQLGFLAELGPADVVDRIGDVVNGAGWVEERMMLRATIRNGAAPLVVDGINDAVISRGARPRAMRINVTIDGQHLHTYVADGVIISTPTGSTAYALSMDGAIIHPEMRTLQITPLAPHLAVVRSVVVPAAAHISMTFDTRDQAVASVDGQVDMPLVNGAVIEVTMSPDVARFVRLQSKDYFYQTLVNRLSTNIVRRLI
jgi:NAD+ kinase